MSEHRDKYYQVQITEANLYVRKMTVTAFVLSLIEKTLLKTPTIILKFYQELFLAQLVCNAGDKKTLLPKSQFVE